MPMQPLAEKNNADLVEEASAAKGTATQARTIEMNAASESNARASARLIEIDGPAGPDPARYGDWERRGRCIDF